MCCAAPPDVEWHDNNTGDQKIATRTGWQKVDPMLMPEACTGECTDEIFLPLIADRASRITRNTVLVLHMIGSHGPAYHLRYPPARARFTPDCRSVQFSECSPEEIVNAYDNSILQTDHVLARSIETLDAADRVLPALIYLSDHGEFPGRGWPLSARRAKIHGARGADQGADADLDGRQL